MTQNNYINVVHDDKYYTIHTKRMYYQHRIQIHMYINTGQALLAV